MRLLSPLDTLLFGCLMAAAAMPLTAQTTESDISARIVGKPLYLRGLWSADKLAFDADGKPEKNYGAMPFTESGFKAESVKLSDGRLQIDGQRITEKFEPNGIMEGLPLKYKHYDGKITIIVRGAPGTDFGKGLDAIFATNLATLTPSLPDYWQYYAQKNFLPLDSALRTESEMDRTGLVEIERTLGANKAGGTINPPRLLKQIEPKYSATARGMKISGKVQLYFWVEEDGSVSHLKIMKPMGLGLDESAMAAVSQYKFAPATQEGKPVKVDIYIDVNFDIF